MKVMVMPFVFDALGMVLKGLEKGLGESEIWGRIETIETTALLRSARILRRVLEICSHAESCERPSAFISVKKSRIVK